MNAVLLTAAGKVSRWCLQATAFKRRELYNKTAGHSFQRRELYNKTATGKAKATAFKRRELLKQAITRNSQSAFSDSKCFTTQLKKIMELTNTYTKKKT